MHWAPGIPFNRMGNRLNAICRKQILNIIETCVVSEIVKSIRNSGKRIEYTVLLQGPGSERSVGILYIRDPTIYPIEAKYLHPAF